MQIYNNFRVLAYDKDSGHMELAWYDDQSPIAGQTILRRNHLMPPELETESWTKAQVLAYILARGEVQDVPDIPQWAIDEAEDTYGEMVFKVRIRTR